MLLSHHIRISISTECSSTRVQLPRVWVDDCCINCCGSWRLRPHYIRSCVATHGER